MPPESTWAYAVKLFYAWDSSRGVWNNIGQYTNTYIPSVFDTTGSVHGDILLFLGNNRYDNNWVGVVAWVWVNPPNPQAGWHLLYNGSLSGHIEPPTHYVYLIESEE